MAATAMAALHLLLLSTAALAAASPGVLPMDATALRKERASALAEFHDPTESPLAAVTRHDFAVGATISVGGSSHDHIRLEGLPAHALQIAAASDGFEIRRDGRTTRFASGKVPLGERYTLRLSHQNFPAVVVLDRESPHLRTGPFPRWFEPDPALRLEARLEKDPHPRDDVLLSTRGTKRRALRMGRLVFRLGGAEQRLTAVRLLEPGVEASSLSVFFRDATTGTESYPVGRYVEAEAIAGDRYLLDFNRAYTPLCAYSPLFNCPIPPKENRLDVPVRAGERMPDGPPVH